ncbi:MAG: ExbD/TolR family protein, partial [Betaproteobacteria bacterium]
ADAPPATGQVEAIQLAIDAEGALHWNNEAVGEDDFADRLARAAKRSPQPELHLRADKATRYERLAQVMAAAQKSGLTRIGFVTEPVEAAAGK